MTQPPLDKICDNCGEPLKVPNENCEYHHHRTKASPAAAELPDDAEATKTEHDVPLEYEIVTLPPKDGDILQGFVDETKPSVSGIVIFKLIADSLEWLDKKLDWLMATHAQEPKKKYGGNVAAKKNSSWKKWAVRIGIAAALLLAGYFLRSWRGRDIPPPPPPTEELNIKAIKLLGDQPIRVANQAFVYAEFEKGGYTGEIKCVFSSGSNEVQVTQEVGPKCIAKIEVGRHQSPIKIDLTATTASGKTDTHSENFEVKDKELPNVVLFGIDILYPSSPVSRGARVELEARFLEGVDKRNFTCAWECSAGRIVSTGHNTALFYTNDLSPNDYRNGVLVQVMAKDSRGITVHQEKITIQFQSPPVRKPAPTPSPQPGNRQTNPGESNKTSSQVKPPG